MPFHPNMDSKVHGVKPIKDLNWRAWPGLLADVWDVECCAGAHGQYVSKAPRLFLLLDADGTTDIDLMMQPDGRERVTLSSRNPMCFIPAGVPIWSSISKSGRLKHLDLHLDVQALTERFGTRFNLPALEETNFGFNDDRIMSLARLIAAECCEPSDLDSLYGDSIVAGLLTVLGNVQREISGSMSGLTPRRLNKVLEHIDQNHARNIALQELADIAGLSCSYFSHAFKASMGLPPHRWQMQRRIETVKSLLETDGMSVIDAALATGFSDQSHLTRAFRRFEGTTPAAWLRNLSK